MTDQFHEERAAYDAWADDEGASSKPSMSTERRAFHAAWQARGEYERARVTATEAQNARLVAALAELLLGGDHDGACTNADDPYDSCEHHVEASKARKERACAVLASISVSTEMSDATYQNTRSVS